MWLIVSIQDEALAYCCIIIGCGPVDYNTPLKGHKFSESLFSRLKLDLWDACWSKCNCAGCGNGLSVPKEANKEKENTSRQKEHYVFKVAVTKMKKHSTAGSVTVNMIIQYRTPTILARCMYSILTWCRVNRLKTGSVHCIVLSCFLHTFYFCDTNMLMQHNRACFRPLNMTSCVKQMFQRFWLPKKFYGKLCYSTNFLAAWISQF